MNDDELKAKEVNGYLDIAQEFLESAQTSFNGKRYKVTVDQRVMLLDCVLEYFHA